MDLDEFADCFAKLSAAVGQTVRGKDEVIRLSLVCLLAEGHLLIEDNPGVGKTTLALALAGSIGGRMKRIQFTPDLLPTDITGTDVLSPDGNQLEFRFGPVFANVVLADEINRASPKTQSALLEVMQEGTVTFGTTTRSVHIDPEHPDLPPATGEPYMVLATQNPLDADGTYPLPAAQLDRFLMRISMGYPAFRHELEVLRAGGSPPPRDAAPVLDGVQVGAMIECAGRVKVTDAAYRYALRIVGATRVAAEGEQAELRLGASPRGSLGLIRAARVSAAAHRRHHVEPDDIKELAPAVLTHRLVPAFSTPESGVGDLLKRILDTVDPLD
jgi:MoxR-like ATPase